MTPIEQASRQMGLILAPRCRAPPPPLNEKDRVPARSSRT